ncbi:ThuA domain-containing protein [Cellulophaga sp. HaHaR_3_176]|uniref:ThuA domain-containing protein n=1 Tax=Cellulophaga sp. HaHaR_3_176 TaxID=1942464 RepID=UPI001C1FD1C9|nr:ThuA domain-containing protein [Cellulophaga sp. HaHaR_3_176]QWX83757.1 ThuA domain-containing protein [Cellulophaga sp. HaHaR_3_176]
MKLVYKGTFLLLFITFLSSCAGTKVDQQVVLNHPEPLRISKSKLEAVKPKVLVFSKTAGYRHEAIEKGISTIRQLGIQDNFEVSQTEDSLQFNAENLKKYQLVLFLSTTQDVLGHEQQEAFESYIQNGGSFMGVHAATDTEYEWSWYGELVGAYFLNHPEQQDARINVLDNNHESTSHLSDTWMHYDEWYNFKNINPDINVVLELDESSYIGGKNGDNHPIAWYHEFDGGRSFYTGLGHTKESYDDTNFRKHLLGGINWCLKR